MFHEKVADTYHPQEPLVGAHAHSSWHSYPLENQSLQENDYGLKVSKADEKAHVLRWPDHEGADLRHQLLLMSNLMRLMGKGGTLGGRSFWRKGQ